jgi:hypothetical protein
LKTKAKNAGGLSAFCPRSPAKRSQKATIRHGYFLLFLALCWLAWHRV